MNKKEKELLNWALQHSSSNTSEIKATKVDEELMEAVLGKTDAKRMTECVQIATNDALALHVRLDALDELEMLVESIDNASDMEKLLLWPHLKSLMNQHPEEEVKKMCLWVMGTAAQNNPQAQEALVKHAVLEDSFALLGHEQEEVRKKAFYVISAMSKPKGSPGNLRFVELNGLNILKLYQEDELLKDKIEFLINFFDGDEKTNGI